MVLRAYGSIDATVGGGKVRKPGGGRGNGNGKGGNGGGGGGAGFWSLTDKAAEITVTANKLTLTGPDAGQATGKIGRGEVAWASGDKYFEVLITGTGSVSRQVGLALASVTTNSTLGTDGDNSVGYRQDGSIWLASSNFGAFSSYTVGDYIGFRWNGTSFYIYKNGVEQNNYTHPNIVGKLYMPAGGTLAAGGTDRSMVLNCSAPFAYLPVGASAWI